MRQAYHSVYVHFMMTTAASTLKPNSPQVRSARSSRNLAGPLAPKRAVGKHTNAQTQWSNAHGRCRRPPRNKRPAPSAWARPRAGKNGSQRTRARITLSSRSAQLNPCALMWFDSCPPARGQHFPNAHLATQHCSVNSCIGSVAALYVFALPSCVFLLWFLFCC